VTGIDLLLPALMSAPANLFNIALTRRPHLLRPLLPCRLPVIWLTSTPLPVISMLELNWPGRFYTPRKFADKGPFFMTCSGRREGAVGFGWVA
jgi:hypothetical protein